MRVAVNLHCSIKYEIINLEIKGQVVIFLQSILLHLIKSLVLFILTPVEVYLIVSALIRFLLNLIVYYLISFLSTSQHLQC